MSRGERQRLELALSRPPQAQIVAVVAGRESVARAHRLGQQLPFLTGSRRVAMRDLRVDCEEPTRCSNGGCRRGGLGQGTVRRSAHRLARRGRRMALLLRGRGTTTLRAACAPLLTSADLDIALCLVCAAQPPRAYRGPSRALSYSYRHDCPASCPVGRDSLPNLHAGSLTPAAKLLRRRVWPADRRGGQASRLVAEV